MSTFAIDENSTDTDTMTIEDVYDAFGGRERVVNLVAFAVMIPPSIAAKAVEAFVKAMEENPVPDGAYEEKYGEAFEDYLDDATEAVKADAAKHVSAEQIAATDPAMFRMTVEAAVCGFLVGAMFSEAQED